MSYLQTDTTSVATLNAPFVRRADIVSRVLVGESGDLSDLDLSGGRSLFKRMEPSTDTRAAYEGRIHEAQTRLEEAQTAAARAVTSHEEEAARYGVAAGALASAQTAFDQARAALTAAEIERYKAGQGLLYRQDHGGPAEINAAQARLATAEAACLQAQGPFDLWADKLEVARTQKTVAGGRVAGANAGIDDANTLVELRHIMLDQVHANQDAAPETQPDDAPPIVHQDTLIDFNLDPGTPASSTTDTYDGTTATHRSSSGDYLFQFELQAAEYDACQAAAYTSLELSWYEVTEVTYVVDSHAPTYHYTPVVYSAVRQTETLALTDGVPYSNDAGDETEPFFYRYTGAVHSLGSPASSNTTSVRIFIAPEAYSPRTRIEGTWTGAEGERFGFFENTTDPSAPLANIGRYLLEVASTGPDAPPGVSFGGARGYAENGPFDTISPHTAAVLGDPLLPAHTGVRQLTPTERTFAQPGGLVLSLGEAQTSAALDAGVLAAAGKPIPDPEIPLDPDHPPDPADFPPPAIDRTVSALRLVSFDGNYSAAQQGMYRVGYESMPSSYQAGDVIPFRLKKTIHDLDACRTRVEYVAVPYTVPAKGAGSEKRERLTLPLPGVNQTVLLEGAPIADAGDDDLTWANWDIVGHGAALVTAVRAA